MSSRKLGVTFSYDYRDPADVAHRAWADAKRRLAMDVFTTLSPNQEYTIRYHEDRRPADRITGKIECAIIAVVSVDEYAHQP